MQVLFRIIMDHMLGNQLVGGSLCAIDAAKRQKIETLSVQPRPFTWLDSFRHTIAHMQTLFHGQ